VPRGRPEWPPLALPLPWHGGWVQSRAGNLADGVVVGHAPAPASAPRRTRSGGGEAEGLLGAVRPPVAAVAPKTTGRCNAMPQPFVVKISCHISTSPAPIMVWQC
jgi:hypothetical protein